MKDITCLSHDHHMIVTLLLTFPVGMTLACLVLTLSPLSAPAAPCSLLRGRDSARGSLSPIALLHNSCNKQWHHHLATSYFNSFPTDTHQTSLFVVKVKYMRDSSAIHLAGSGRGFVPWCLYMSEYKCLGWRGQQQWPSQGAKFKTPQSLPREAKISDFCLHELWFILID